MTPPPFCKDCKHFIGGKPGLLKTSPGEPSRCGAAEMIDVVEGGKFFVPCNDFRSSGAPCGFAGVMFIAKSLPKSNQPEPTNVIKL